MEGKLTRDLATWCRVLSAPNGKPELSSSLTGHAPLSCQWRPVGRLGGTGQSTFSFSLMEWHHKKSIRTETSHKIWNLITEYPKCPGCNKKKKSHTSYQELKKRPQKEWNNTLDWCQHHDDRDLNSLTKTLKQLW